MSETATLTPLQARVAELIHSGFPAVWVQTYEPEDALTAILELAEQEDWKAMTWDSATGLNGQTCEDPQGAVKSLPQIGKDDQRGILVMQNLHFHLRGASGTGNPFLIQEVATRVGEGKRNACALIVLSPVVEIPVELETLFTVVEHDLPNRDQLERIARSVANEEDINGDFDRVLDAAGGLPEMAAENAFALSLYRKGTLDPATVFEVKAATLKNAAGITLHEGGETFADVGGLTYMKEYCTTSLAVREPNPKFRSRGILIKGVSGGGKSLFAKALGNEVGRPTLCFDIGSTFGGLMGESQAKFRGALKKAEAMAPCILFLDEIEKMLTGAGDDAKTSGGLKTELFGYFLTWLQERTADVYVIATANDIRPVSNRFPEFLRRFDDLFFVDFPGRASKDMIWRIHLSGYELIEPEQELTDVSLPNDLQWTGAEIENCCRKARQQRKPVAEIGAAMPRLIDQAKEGIEEIRAWATGKCYAAEYNGRYEPREHEKILKEIMGDGPRRVVRRGPGGSPSVN